MQFGNVEVADGGPSFDDGIDVFASNTRLTVTAPLDAALPYEVITEGGSSGRLTDVTGTPATAETGTPTVVSLASANVGQSVTLEGNGFVEGVTKVTLEAMSSTGVPVIITVDPDSVAADGRSLVLTVPLDARTGTATTLSGGGGRFLQIVPTLSVAPPVVPGAVLTLIGNGFIEGFTTVRFGNASVIDGGPSFDDGVDVFASNTRLTVTVPVDGSTSTRVTTEGGSSNAVFP